MADETVPEEVQRRGNELVDAGQGLANAAYDAGEAAVGQTLGFLFSTIKRLSETAEGLANQIGGSK